MSAAAGPELVRDVPLLGGDARGLLVIDRLVGGESFGGLRFAPGTSLDELAACARTMTLKHAFVRYPVGGAKAALDLPRGAEPAARRAALREFGAALAPLLHAGTYRAGIDMDCAPDDLAAFHAGAGLHADFSGWKNVSHVYTAWSVFAATLAALETLGRPTRGATYVVQGFGKVGGEYCRLMSAAGARLVGVANAAGVIGDPAGLDVDDLLARRAEQGERFVLGHPGGRGAPGREVLECAADVTVPCARAWAIDEHNCERVRAAIVPCAANAPMTREVERRLVARGVVVITDYVANCGGVFGSLLERYLDRDDIRALLFGAFAAKVRTMLARSRDAGASVADLADAEVAPLLARASARSATRAMRLAKRALDALPRAVSRRIVLSRAARIFAMGTGGTPVSAFRS